jgi:nucleotide-binding universal stress UspA family protein
LGLALATGASLRLMHAVFMPKPVKGIITGSIGQLQEDAQSDLESMAMQLQAWLVGNGLPGVKIKADVRVGFPGDEIIAASKSYKSDIVVIGTEGAGGAKGLFVGSNAAAVIKNAHCPVVVVPQDAPWTGLPRLAFATDLELIDVEMLDILAKLGLCFQSKIEVLHISPASSTAPMVQVAAFTEKLHALHPGMELSFSDYSIEDSDISAAIERIATAHESSLLAVLRREHGGLAGLFHASLSKKLALHAKLPLLVCR